MEWLAASAAETDVVVQAPVRDRRGELVAAVDFPDLQVAITQEPASERFARNLKELASSFCSDLASGKPFVFE